MGRSRTGVGVDGRADGVAPAVAAEGAAVFVSCKVDALDHDLGEIGEGAGGFGRDVAAGGGGEEASESGVEDSPAGVNRRYKKSPDGVGAQR